VTFVLELAMLTDVLGAMFTDADAEQLFPSVTVTVYAPLERLLAEESVPPDGDHK
jgi:hypothetical protein